MELKKENLLENFNPTGKEQAEYISREDRLRVRAMQLYKVAEFLNEYFDKKYNEDLFQARCLWCRVQLDKDFFDKLTEAAKNKEQTQRLEIMKELHIYVEDFLIAYCKEFYKLLDQESQTWVIYAGHFLHFRMDTRKLENFFHLTEMLKEEA